MRRFAFIIFVVDVSRLAEIFQRYPGIQAVYLFDSFAEGRARPDSDIDLAISNLSSPFNAKHTNGEFSMPTPDVIQKRLQKLDEYLAILRNLRRYNLEEFLSDPEHYGSDAE